MNAIAPIAPSSKTREKLTAKTVPKHNNLRSWKPGQSGNPAGRPKGARHKLGEAFIEDMHQAWKANGREVIQRVMHEDPAAFLRSIVAILPKQHDIKLNRYEELDETQLKHAFASAIAEAAKLGIEMPSTTRTIKHDE